jgi:hypothetical protein
MNNPCSVIDKKIDKVTEEHSAVVRELAAIKSQRNELRSRECRTMRLASSLLHTLKSLEKKKRKLIKYQEAVDSGSRNANYAMKVLFEYSEKGQLLKEKQEAARVEREEREYQRFLRFVDVAEILRWYLVIGEISRNNGKFLALFLIHRDKKEEMLFRLTSMPNFHGISTLEKLAKVPCPFGDGVFSCVQGNPCYSYAPCNLKKLVTEGIGEVDFGYVLDILIEMCRIDGVAYRFNREDQSVWGDSI